MFNWVTYRLFENFQSEAKVEEIIAIVTTRSVSCLIFFCSVLTIKGDVICFTNIATQILKTVELGGIVSVFFSTIKQI